MPYYPAIVFLILAIVDWIATDKKVKSLEYVVKPATMLALLWWIGQSVGWGGTMLWFTIGVMFCLAGDVLLMIPRNMFIFGLLSFLLGHVAYIIGLNNAPPYGNIMGLFLLLVLRNPLAIVTLVILVICIIWTYPKLSSGLVAKGKKSLRIPVLIYSLIISLMVYSALMTWNRAGWSAAAALSASIGAVLFYVSDLMNAWDRFLTPFSHARLWVMATYHLGQIGIILGAIFHALTK